MALRCSSFVILAVFYLYCVQSLHGTRITWGVKSSITRTAGDNTIIDLSSLITNQDLTSMFSDDDVTGADNDVINLGEVNLEDIITSCHMGKCEFCMTVKVKVCVVAEIQGSGFLLTVTINSHVIFKKEIDIVNPPPICVPTVPGLPIVDVCVQLTNVNIKDLSACVSISLKLKFLHKKLTFKIGCFRIPHVDIIDTVPAEDVTVPSHADLPDVTDQRLTFLKVILDNRK